MRTLIDIPEDDLSLLNKLGKRSGASRAQLVRQAIASFLEPHKHSDHVEAFGLWAGRGVDGLAYQRKMRDEW
jgi:metal-responsive CopG/Arc/MetJ family transcriptional regulator